jgi:DHA2 family multidrug resistance protein
MKIAAFVGAPTGIVSAHQSGAFDADKTAVLDPLVQTASSVQAINEAWLLVAILTACAITALPFATRVAPGEDGA